ncbi:hypothetical protein Tco_1502095 [Tanacetum coccineum]
MAAMVSRVLVAEGVSIRCQAASGRIVLMMSVSTLLERETFSKIYIEVAKNAIFYLSVDYFKNTNSLGHSLHRQIPFYLHSAILEYLTHECKTGRSLLHDNIVPKPDLALELGKSISLTEAEEEAVAREVHATHAEPSSEGTGSKPGVPDEEKLILEWEADVDSEHFDRDDNTGDDNEETKPDPEEIYK